MLHAIEMPDARKFFSRDLQIEVQCDVPGWTRLHMAPEPKLREKVTAFLRNKLADLPDDLCEQLSLAADELLGNSIEHGCGLDPECFIELTCLRTERMVAIHIKDAGPGFSIDELDHAAVNNPPEQPLKHTHFRSERGMRPGGFGIMLVQKIADDLIYNEEGNEVVLVKYLDNLTARK